MRKKYLSALLFGALLFASAGTFTSCKDYDDDIAGLQDQITPLSSKLTSVESTLSDLQKADSDLQAKIDAATDAADKAILEAQQNAVKEAAAQLETAKAELTELINNNKAATDEAIAAINTELAKVKGQVEALEKLSGDIKALQDADLTLSAAIKDLDEKVQTNAIAIGELQAAVKTQADALEAYKTSNGADVTALQADVKALQDKVLELAGSDEMATLSEQIEQLKEDAKTVSAKIDEIDSKLNSLFIGWYEGITGVSLNISDVASYNAQNIALLSEKAVATTTFGEELKNNSLFSAIKGAPISFTEGERTKLEASFLMRVFPTTAIPDKNDIKLINSVGEDLVAAKQVEVVSVKKNDEVLTRAGENTTGLWKVTLKVAEGYSDEVFDGLTTRIDNRNITYPLFAVAIEDTRVTSEGKPNRSVVSEYNLTFANNVTKPVANLKFTVNGISVNDINNRAVFNMDAHTSVGLPTEYVWSNGAAAKPIYEGALKNVMEGDGYRSYYDYLYVTSGDDITIKFTDTKSIIAYYVVIDKNCATSSDESEIRAWNAIEGSIEGINQLYYTTETNGKITLRFTEDVNDIVGFRVYAVNANGTLADPDGRSFYVKVGKSAETTASAHVNVIPFKSTPSDNKIETTITNLDEIKALLKADKKYYIEYTIDDVFKYYQNDPQGNEISRGNAFTWSLLNENTEVVAGIDIYGNEGKTDWFTGSQFAEITKAELKLNTQTEWKDYTDDKTYTGKLLIKDNNNNAIAIINLSMKKELPIGANAQIPAGFKWKDNQIADNVYACFLIPDSWNPGTATQGTRQLKQIFEFGNEATFDADKYVITFNTKDASETKNTIKDQPSLENLQNSTIHVGKSSIDNTTKYAVTVAYNFGKISSQDPNKDIICTENYNVTYNCYFDSQYTWSLDTKVWDGKIPYGENFKLTDKTIDEAIKGVSSYDGLYDCHLNEPYEGAIKINSAKVISNGSQNADYFTAVVTTDGHITELTFNADSSNPVADVASTLVINITDMYGHKKDIKIPVTVTKR